MDIYAAVASRRAVRAFTDEPVPRAVLERVLTAAARAPSGGNLQPWHLRVLTGAPQERTLGVELDVVPHLIDLSALRLADTVHGDRATRRRPIPNPGSVMPERHGHGR